MMGNLVKVPFKYFIITVVLFPLVAFIFCVLLSILNNFEDSTSTHCHVKNYLPSISTAVGGFAPQKYIWRMSIAFHSGPRFLISYMYYNHCRNVLPKESMLQQLVPILFTFQSIEIASLVGLTYISSSEDFSVHQKLFVLFLMCSVLSMSLLYVFLKNGLTNKVARIERKSIKLKFILLSINFLTFCASVYFYFRHNWYCESGMYTLFALAEYAIVLSNIAYHLTAVWDFRSHFIIVSSIQTYCNNFNEMLLQ